MPNRFPLHESRHSGRGGECRALNVEELNLNLTSGLAIARNPPLCFRQIPVIDFESDKFLHAAELRCYRGISDAKERIKHRLNASRACRTVLFDAPLG